MNKFIEHMNNRRSIRKFKSEPIDETTLNTIFDAMLKTATGNGAHNASVIRVISKEKKQLISEVAKQPYIADAPELLIFVTDLKRHYAILKEKGVDVDSRSSDVDYFFRATYDALLMAGQTANIIESLGLGSVFLGSILNDAQKIIDILGLPELTFPALGLLFGNPDSDQMLKPKMPKELRLFEDTYKVLPDYLKAVKDYDEEMTTYYDQRMNNKRSDTYSNTLVTVFNMSPPKRNKLLEIARNNGFKI